MIHTISHRFDLVDRHIHICMCMSSINSKGKAYIYGIDALASSNEISNFFGRVLL